MSNITIFYVVVIEHASISNLKNVTMCFSKIPRGGKWANLFLVRTWMKRRFKKIQAGKSEKKYLERI